MTRLWHKGEPLDQVIERFTVGRDPELDLRLLRYDALGSAAHATMLARIGVLGEDELAAVLRELAAVARDAERGEMHIARADEDCHTAIENRLTERLGDAGRKVHTGRSRNDQIIAATRLWAREIVLAQIDATLETAALCIDVAERERDTLVAGYTHTRQAMPSTFGLLFGSAAEALLDDVPWLQQAFAHIDRSPLGSASGYGVALPLDRQLVSDLLGFSRVQLNTLAVQNDRGKSEYLALGAAAATVTDLSRLAADLIYLSSDELRAVKLANEVTTGSSIMPNKRNPDVLELIRAAAARLRARQSEIGAVYGHLSSGYHRDLQLTKEPFVEGMQLALDALSAMQPVLRTLEVDGERAQALLGRAIDATDAVYRRVAAGEPFRNAYREVAKDPAGAAGDGEIGAGWREREHLGAPGALDLDPARTALSQGRTWSKDVGARLEAVWQLLPSDPA